MQVVVVGGTGLIGSRLVELLREAGHEAVAAAPSTGVDTVTGEGLAQALTGADVVVDVANSPSFADGPVLAFFTASTRNLLAAGARAGVGHHVVLSVVGADRLPDSGYLRAKVAQEDLVRGSGRPYTILRATQFFEFVPAIADAATDGGTVTVGTAAMQPTAAADVSAALAELAVAPPRDATLDLAGPERLPMADLVARVLAGRGDPRRVDVDPAARYFGALADDGQLVPAGEAIHTPTTLAGWLARAVPAR